MIYNVFSAVVRSEAVYGSVVVYPLVIVAPIVCGVLLFGPFVFGPCFVM